MDLYLLIGASPYFCFLVIIFSGLLFRKPIKTNQTHIPFVSVVISARNEEKNKDDKIISFHLFEIYKNSAALDFHRETVHYKDYRSKIEDLLEKPREVKVLNSIDSI